MGTIVQDLRYGLRTLLKTPGFSVVAITALALGIGANTAIFSVVNAVLLKPLPFPEADRLVKVWPQKPPTAVSKAEFVELRDHNQSFDDLAAYSGWSFTLTGRDEPAKLEGARTTASLFSLLGIKAVLGRTFAADEDQPGHSDVALLSYGSWERRFGLDPNIIGRSLTIDGQSVTVVGVLPPSFRFPDTSVAPSHFEIVVPAPLDAGAQDFTAGYLTVLARLKRNVTTAQAQADVVRLSRNVRAQFPRAPDNYGLEAAVRPLHDDLVGDSRVLLLILLGAVGLVLLIACANVGNLQLARTNARRREIALRAALGARRRRLVRQLLTESITLSLIGGAVGVPLAIWTMGLLVSLLPAEMPRLNDARVDLRVLGFSLGVSLITGVIFGLAPALQSGKVDLQTALNKSGRTTSARGGRLHNLLMVVEFSLALVLVLSAGLLIKSFWRLRQVDPGFRAENVLSMQLAPPDAAYSEDSRKRAFYHQVIERAETLPGVSAAGGIHLLPLGGNNWNPGLRVEDHPQPAGATLPLVDWRLITPGYFKTMGTPLIKGRWFMESDNENAPGVTIVNETLARTYWPGEDPIGKRIRGGFEGKQWVAIVGVVGDVKEQALDLPTHLEMYRPYDQTPFPSSLVLMVRTSTDPKALAEAIRKQIWAVDKDVPVADVQLLTEVIAGSLAARRSTTVLLAAFAAVALLLGAVGIYGVVSYSVGRRTHEIGVRVALGATPSDVLRLIVGQSMRLIVQGLVLGLVGAYFAGHVMRSLLFGVAATDPLTFVLTAVLLTGVAVLACLVPARRALRVDPLVALRYE